MRKKWRKGMAVVLSALLVSGNLGAGGISARAEVRGRVLEEFESLSEDTLSQTVPFGTKKKDLNLPRYLNARLAGEENEGGKNDGTEATPSQAAATGSDADRVQDSSASDGSGSSDTGQKKPDGWKKVAVIWVLNEDFSVQDTYDGQVPGSYRFEAELSGGRYGLGNADLPVIEVEVLNSAVTITGWAFSDDEFLTAGELIISTVNEDNPIRFDQIVSMLPEEIEAETDRADDGGRSRELITIAGWSCPAFKQDGGGRYPLEGIFTFTAKLPEGYACSTPPSVKVVLSSEAGVMTINDRHKVDGLVYKETGPDTVQLIGLVDSGYEGVVSVPAEISVDGNTYAVTGIGGRAFYERGITGLDLSGADNLTYIGAYAFSGTRKLEGMLIIPAGVTEIRISAFYGSGITEMDLSRADNLRLIEREAFNRCKNLSMNLTIPAGVVKIGDGAFSDSGITGLDLGGADGLTHIGYSAFRGCVSLTGEVTIPESVTEIGSFAFRDSSGITGFIAATNAVAVLLKESGVAESDIRLPDGTSPQFTDRPVKEFQDGILNYAIIGPGAVSVIGFAQDSFGGQVIIPAEVNFGDETYRVTEIGNQAFMFSSEITGLDLSGADNLQRIGQEAFSNCLNLHSVAIPASVTEIDGWAFLAFAGYGGLNDLDLSGAYHLRRVGDMAFYGALLSGRLTIPASVTDIGEHAFNMNGLTDVVIEGRLHTLGDFAFPNVPIYCADPATQLLVNEAVNLDQYPSASWDGVGDIPKGAVVRLDGSAGSGQGVKVGGDAAIKKGASLTVESGGALTVESGASLTVETGGTLTVQSGGLLVIEDGGTVRIESGAILTIEDGGKVDGTGRIVVEPGGILNGTPGPGITVVYIHNLTVTSGSGGSAFGPSLGIEGETVTVTAVPDSGYRFKEWQSGDTLTFTQGGRTSQNAGFIMPGGDVSVKAVFEIDTPTETGSTSRSSDRGVNPVLHGSWEHPETDIWKFKLTSGGYAASRWGLVDGRWYYFDAEGRMAAGWRYDAFYGNWYYLASLEDTKRIAGLKEGDMITGWYFDPLYQRWFYLDEGGAMVTGWREIDGNWYYFNPAPDGMRGAMAADAWIDGRYVDGNGVRAD